MNLKEYSESIQKLLSENPEAAGYQVVASSDDEGGTYSGIYWEMSIGYYEDWDFCPEDSKDETDDWEPNAVCIN